MRLRRFGRMAATLTAFSLVATACGGGDDSSEPDPDGGNGGQSAAGEPTSGGSVVYGLEAETSGGWCMPEAQLAISGIQVARAIYDTLLAPDADGEYVPFLAESLESNEDFTEWTITLREGVTFHDGSALDSTVVKNNLDAYRGAYPAREPLLLRFIFDPVTGVEVVDDLTLKVSTDIPWPAFPAALFAEGRAGIIAQAQLDDAETCDAALIGTGPFMLDDWTVNESLTANRNPDYWGTDEAGNQLPYLDSIEFRPMVDPAGRANAVVGGEVDLAHSAGPTEIAQWQAEAEARNIGLESSTEFAEVTYTLLNSSRPPFDSLNARLAAAHAMDREELNEVRNQGMFDIATGPFAPGNTGYLEDTGFPEHDVEAAKEFAAAYEAETGQPLTFTYTYQNDAEVAQTAQLFQDQWGRAGIEVDIVPIEQAVLISTAISGDYESIAWRNHPGGDPDAQYIWWYEGSPLNFGNIADPEINVLLDEGRSESDEATRTGVYEELNSEFGAEAYNLWLNWVEWNIAHDNDVGGIWGPPLPDGSEAFTGLSTGHPVSGIWVAD